MKDINGPQWELLKELPGIPVGRRAKEDLDGSVTFAFNGRTYRFNKYELRLMPDWVAKCELRGQERDM